MRLLILALLAYIAATVSIWLPRFPGERDEAAPRPRLPEPQDDASLGGRLEEAAANFGAAAAEAPEGPLREALASLAARCGGLSERARRDELGGGARLPVMRLLLPLYGIAPRAVTLARQGGEEATVASATDLIVRANTAMQRIDDRAAERERQRLEAELEVLEARLR